LLKLAEDDPEAERWEVVNLEAVKTDRTSTPGDHRLPTQSLWESRFGRDFLKNAKATLGTTQFEAMYQGSPVAEGGNHFKEVWFRPRWIEGGSHDGQESYLLKWPEPPRSVLYYHHMCPRFVIVDPAAGTKQSNDFTAIGVFSVTPTNELLVLNMVRERLGVDRIVPKLLEVCGKWNPDWIGMEANGFQVALSNEAKKQRGLPAVRELSHRGRDKLVRATPAIIKAEGGQILLPNRAPWVKPLLEELVQFTGEGDKHDDQVDVLAYAVIGMTSAGGAKAVKPEEKPRGFGGQLGW
jgi:predicted phage terminase large subunit-like protein